MKNPNQNTLQIVRDALAHNPKADNKLLMHLTGMSERTCSRYVKIIRDTEPHVIGSKLRESPVDGLLHAIHGLDPPYDEKAAYPANRHITHAQTNEQRKCRMVVGLPDMHLPYSHREMLAPSAKAALSFCNDTKPDEIVLMGDFLDLGCISHWKKEYPGKKVNQYLSRDIEVGNMVLDIIQSCSDKTTYLTGNHEVWLDNYTDEDPHGRSGIYDLNSMLRLYERGIELINENIVYQAGKANITHGWCCNKYHANTHVDQAMDNMFYGHTHDIQCFSKTKRSDKHPVIAHSCGCLCDRNPDFLRNKPNRWASGFLVLYIRDDGSFTYYVPQILNGKFIWTNGKEYSA